MLCFRRRLETSRELFFCAFDQRAEFERQLRGLFAQWRRDHEDGNLTRDGRVAHELPLMPPPSNEITVPNPPALIRHYLKWLGNAPRSGRLTEAETLLPVALREVTILRHSAAMGRFSYEPVVALRLRLCFERILELSSASDRIWQAIAYGNIGLVRELSSDFAGAEKMHRKSLAINQELGRLDGMAQVQNNLGIIEKRKGHLAGADELFRLALENGRKAEREDIIGRAYNNLGLLYRDKRRISTV